MSYPSEKKIISHSFIDLFLSILNSCRYHGNCVHMMFSLKPVIMRDVGVQKFLA